MGKCIECGADMDRDHGLLINLCKKCIAKPEIREQSYIKRGKLLIPNENAK